MPVLATIGEGLAELELDDDDRDPGCQLRVAPGGDAANIAVMAARLGAPARLGGRIGADFFGDWLRSFWHGTGVDVDTLHVDPQAPTGLYLNSRSADGNHSFSYWRSGSAGSRLTPRDLDDRFFRDVGILAVTGIGIAVSASSADAVRTAVTRAKLTGIPVACVLNYRAALGGDPAVLAALARRANIVIGSCEDADAVFGESDPIALSRGPLTGIEIVVSAGEDDACAVVDGRVIRQRVPSMTVVNAAGAGDALAGAYLARRLCGRPVEEALAWGVAASACSVTQAGCARSYPTLQTTAALVDELRNAG